MAARNKILLGLICWNVLFIVGIFGKSKPLKDESHDLMLLNSIDSLEKPKRQHPDDLGDKKLNSVRPGFAKRYYLDHFGDSLLDKRYYLDHFGDSLLDKKSSGAHQSGKRYFLDHFGDSLLDKRDDQWQKRYYLDHFGDSLLDKRN